MALLSVPGFKTVCPLFYNVQKRGVLSLPGSIMVIRIVFTEEIHHEI
jgi:hypothetical protein